MACMFSVLTQTIVSTRRLAKMASTDVPKSVHIAVNDVDKVITNPHGKTWATIVNHVGQMKRQSAASNPVLSVLIDELKAWIEGQKGYKSHAKCDEPSAKKAKVAAKSQTSGDDEPVKFLMSMGNELAKNAANPMIAFMREMRERDEHLCNELANVKNELRMVNATANDTAKLAVQAYLDNPDNEEELKDEAVDLYLENNDVKDAVVERLQVELHQVKEQLRQAKEELEEKKGLVDPEEEFENLSTTDDDFQYKYVKKDFLSKNIEAYMNNEVKATLKNMTAFHSCFEFQADDDVSNIIERFFVEAMELAGVDYDQSKSLFENIEEHVKKESDDIPLVIRKSDDIPLAIQGSDEEGTSEEENDIPLTIQKSAEESDAMAEECVRPATEP